MVECTGLENQRTARYRRFESYIFRKVGSKEYILLHGVKDWAFPGHLLFDLVVQLVRIQACHAWGRGFESLPDRQNYIKNRLSVDI